MSETTEETKPAGRVVDRPGHINVQMAGTGTVAHGCAVIEFVDAGHSAGTQFMEWAAEHRNMLIVDVKYAPGHIFVLYTNQLTREQLEELREVEQVTQSALQDLRQRRAVEKAAQKKAVQEAVDETQRLAELGRVHEANCSKKAKKGK